MTLVVALVGFGIFTYIRVTSFLDNSFSGRNEASLLTVAPSPTAAPQPTGQPVRPTTNSRNSAGPTATPAPRLPNLGELTPVSTLPTVTPSYASLPAIIQKIKSGQPVTTLLLGYGGSGHDGAFLTDTILELTYDPARNAVTMVNIPRDLYVFVPYGGPKVGYWGKINSAFSYVMEAQSSTNLSSRYRFNLNDQNSRIDAAVNLTKDVVENVTGTPVDYWATISFDGFRKFIDAIGGVNVTVETTFDDYDYPANDDPQIDASVMHIHFEAGPQHLNGERAIEYARSRKSAQDGNDFSRSKRQMRLITAVKEEASQPSIMLKAFGMMDALQGNIRTSLSVNEAKALLDYFRGEGAASLKNTLFVSQIISTNFLTDGTSSDGAYILYPLAGQSNYTAIQQWLEQGREFPEVRVEGLRVQVQNASGQQTLLRQFNADLEQNGLDTLDPIRISPTTTSLIYDYTNSKSSTTMRVITGFLPSAPIITAKKPATQSADIIIVLGQDYQQSGGNSPDTGASSPRVMAGGLITPGPTSSSSYRPTATPDPYNQAKK